WAPGDRLGREARRPRPAARRRQPRVRVVSWARSAIARPGWQRPDASRACARASALTTAWDGSYKLANLKELRPTPEGLPPRERALDARVEELARRLVAEVNGADPDQRAGLREYALE